MKKYILSTLAFVATVFAQAGNQSAVISIQADQPKQIISKHIYGHFAEHLGNKYSQHGYIRLWIPGSENEANLKQLRELMTKKDELRKIFNRIYDEEKNL